MRTHSNSHMHTNAHTHVHTRTRAHTHTHTHMHTLLQGNLRARSSTNTHIHTHAYRHTHTHTHTRTLLKSTCAFAFLLSIHPLSPCLSLFVSFMIPLICFLSPSLLLSQFWLYFPTPPLSVAMYILISLDHSLYLSEHVRARVCVHMRALIVYAYSCVFTHVRKHTHTNTHTRTHTLQFFEQCCQLLVLRVALQLLLR